MKISKKSALKWSALALAVLAVGFLAFRYWKGRQSALPEGIASGNGRLEAKLVDIASKEPLRVKEILVDEGALVRPGQVLVRMDTTTIEAELSESEAKVAAAEERLALARASIAKQKSEIRLAKIEVDRSRNLVAAAAGSQRELDTRTAKLETTRAALAQAEAMLETSQQEIESAKANAAAIQTRIDDATLESPVTGRVLYRLTEPGEVLPAGGAALTVVNLEDVYMEIFLPAEQAARTTIGAEGRITLDYDPDRAIPGAVSFVSPEAQFTPKQVETKSEREKLMFRVKIQLPKELAAQFVERIKTGVRGVGYVKLVPSAVWPDRLQNLVQPPAERVSSLDGLGG